MYSEIYDNITRLTNKIKDIRNQAVRQGRGITPTETSLIDEMQSEINDLKMQLPDRPLTLENFGSRTRGNTQTGPFKNAGEFFQAVARSSVPGNPVDTRLYAAATGANETVPSEGGFLLQQDFAKDILQAAFETGKLAKLCRRIQISGNSNGVKIPGLDETSRASGSRAGGVVSYWKSEASQLTASKPAFRQVELDLKKNVVLIYTTDELLADASVLEAVIRKTAIDELAFSLDDAIVNGTGAGQPLGITKANCLVQVTKEAGQRAATVVAENVIKMHSRLFASSRQNAVWLINQNIEPQLFAMSLAVGTGGIPIYMPAGGLSGQPYGTLFGRPVLPIEQCASLGTCGDIILADLTNGYIIAEKGGIESAVSIHIKFDYDESVFRFIMRVDGSPMLASAITPYKGSDSLSHFVAIETRD